VGIELRKGTEMNTGLQKNDFEVGFDVPAAVGMDESEIQTPCLIDRKSDV